MWTAENRPKYERKGLRYESDLTNEEWELVEPLLPPVRKVCRREVLNGILYILTTGCQWRMLPKDLPPKSTVHDYFIDWHGDGTLARIHAELYGKCQGIGRQEAFADAGDRRQPERQKRRKR